MNLTPDRVRDAVVYLIALILSIAVHEFGHAITADKLGDRTPRYQGRVTLNPLAHADPIGTILFPLIGIFFSTGVLFGWGKPVQINPVAFTRRFSMSTGHLIVAAAGPAMNVVLAFIVTAILATLLATHVITFAHPLAHGLILVIHLNWVLCFFNLIPCPPLDGGAVLAGVLPRKYDYINQFLNQYGFIILMGLLITGLVSYPLYPATAIVKLTIRLLLGIAF